MNGILILLRGCPGAGKSTFAHFICTEQAICEADQYFIGEDGVYRFDASKIKDAHKWCRDKVETMMKTHSENSQHYPKIAVSNTFTQEWEMEPYVELAKQYDYKLFSIIVENRHGGTNVHGCPEETVQVMKNRFSIQL